MTTDGANLSATVGSPTLSTDVIYPDGGSAADTEALLTELAPLLLPVLTDALGEIAIPSIQGFNIQNLTLNVVDGNLVMTGALSTSAITASSSLSSRKGRSGCASKIPWKGIGPFDNQRRRTVVSACRRSGPPTASR